MFAARTTARAWRAETTLPLLPAGRVHGQARGFSETSKEEQQFHSQTTNSKFETHLRAPFRPPSACASAVADAPLWTGRSRRATRASAPSPRALPPAPPPASTRHGRVRCRRAPRFSVPAGVRRRRGPLQSPNQNKRRCTYLVWTLCVHFSISDRPRAEID